MPLSVMTVSVMSGVSDPGPATCSTKPSSKSLSASSMTMTCGRMPPIQSRR
jgi:hypothetical protein